MTAEAASRHIRVASLYSEGMPIGESGYTVGSEYASIAW
jgi:hypothetical protein